MFMEYGQNFADSMKSQESEAHSQVSSLVISLTPVHVNSYCIFVV
jgi:hypothetical protein